jgi:hypothetical protein
MTNSAHLMIFMCSILVCLDGYAWHACRPL